MFVREARECRLCGERKLFQQEGTVIIDLGSQALAGDFLREGRSTRKEPLELWRCLECGLVQLGVTVDPRLLFNSGYGYRSGTNELMKEHLKIVAEEAMTMLGRYPYFVLDIGANDGTLLSYFPHSLRLGYEPAQVPEIPGCEFTILHETFHHDPDNAEADIITSIAMFYDLDEPAFFVSNIWNTLNRDGIWVSEQTYLPTMLENTMYDTICHEHLTYWCLGTFSQVLDRADMRLIDVKTNDINGGSFLTTAVREDSDRYPSPEAQQRIDVLLRREYDMELDTAKPYQEFAARVDGERRTLRDHLWDYTDKTRIYGYGASTKGNVILQYCDIGTDIIPFIADRNPDKWGLTVPTGQTIISEEQAREEADAFFILPYAFLDNFMEREVEFLKSGGRFIIPLPEVRVIKWPVTPTKEPAGKEQPTCSLSTPSPSP